MVVTLEVRFLAKYYSFFNFDINETGQNDYILLGNFLYFNVSGKTYRGSKKTVRMKGENG